jgi:hypothetical protein
MKVKLVFKKNSIPTKHRGLIKEFIHFLYKKLMLKKDIKIIFLTEREYNMSTGARRFDGVIFVLCKKRIIRDILRTLTHEWVHEYQFNVLGREKGADIGGVNEDEANAIAGKLIKLFEKENPQIEKIMYEHKL